MTVGAAMTAPGASAPPVPAMTLPAPNDMGRPSEFFAAVPREFHANLSFRLEMIELGESSAENAAALWEACRRDLLFYVSTFVWTYDPRKNPSAMPFIPYPFQESAMLEVLSAITGRGLTPTAIEAANGGVTNGYDLVIEKSRDMGASWMMLIVYEWLWKFYDLQSFLCVSRKEDLVDKPDDPKSLFWKIDFIHKHMPGFLSPSVTRTKLHIGNNENGSTIDGESTTGDVARGDRRTSIMLDEFASVDTGHSVLAATRDATNCRLFNSTPKGVGNAFYDVTVKPEFRKLRLHWTLHPEKARGLYYDPKGKPRSPWYDEQCRRASHPMEIAQELDIDYLGSDFQFFDQTSLTEHSSRYGMTAYLTGELDFDPDTLEPRGFIEHPKGRVRLWITPDGTVRMPDDRLFCVAADIATGTGASNSAISVGDCKTGEKVLEFASPLIKPNELAKYAVAIAKWFRGSDIDSDGAYMIWEANGPGRLFGDAVLESGFRNVYYRRNDRTIDQKVTDVPGWYNTPETMLSSMGEYRRAIAAGEFINRSLEAVAEAAQYVFTATGTVEHSRAKVSIDPTGARANHGDRVIADMLCWKAMRERRPKIHEAHKTSVPEGSFAWRRDRHRAKQKAKTYW